MANKIKIAGTTSNTFQVGSQGVTLSASEAAAPYTLVLPANTGAASQFLQTDGDGNLTWAAGGAAGSFATETFTAVATQTVFVLNESPTGNAVVAINGITIPNNASNVSSSSVNYDDANNEAYVLKDGDLVTISYMYGTTADVQSLGSLSDVNVNTPLTGQSLTYNAVTGKWTNSTSSGTPAAIANGTSGIDIASADANIAVSVNGNANIAVFTDTSVKLAADLLPNANITYDLGSSSARWKDLYLSGSTIYIGEANIKSYQDTVLVKGLSITANGSADIANIPADGGLYVEEGIKANGGIEAIGNITAGNVITANEVVAGTATFTDMNVTNITITGTVDVSSITNGNSNVVVSANANVTISSNGVANIMTVSGSATNTNYTTTADALLGATEIVLNSVTGLTVGQAIRSTGVTANDTTITAIDVPNLTITLSAAITAAATTGAVFYTTQEDNLVTVSGALAVTAGANLGAVSDVTITGGSSGQLLTTDGTGNLSWIDGPSAGDSGVSVPTAGGNVEITSGGITVVTATSNGAVLEGNVTTINSTNTSIGGNSTTISSNNTSITGITQVSGNTTLSGNTTTISGNSTTISSNNTSITGNVDASSSSNVTLGEVANIHIAGGTSGQFLQTDGDGNLTWASAGGGSASLGNSVIAYGSDFEANSDVDHGFAFTTNSPAVTSGVATWPAGIITFVNSGSGIILIDSLTTATVPIAGATIIFGFGATNNAAAMTTWYGAPSNLIDFGNGTYRLEKGFPSGTQPQVGDYLFYSPVASITGATTGSNVVDVNFNGTTGFTVGDEVNVTQYNSPNLASPPLFPLGTTITAKTGSQFTLSNVALESTSGGSLNMARYVGPTVITPAVNFKGFMGYQSNVNSYVLGFPTSYSSNAIYLDVTDESRLGNLYINHLDALGGANLGAVGNVTITGGSNLQFLQTNGSGALTWATVSLPSITNGNSNVVVAANGNVSTSVAGNANILVVTGTGANIAGTANVTGNLAIGGNLAIVGNITSAANITGDANIGGNISVTGTSTFTGNITANGKVTANANVVFIGSNVSLGNVANLHITGGSNLQFLQTNGDGNLAWASPAAAALGNLNAIATGPTGWANAANFTVGALYSVQYNATGQTDTLIVFDNGAYWTYVGGVKTLSYIAQREITGSTVNINNNNTYLVTNNDIQGFSQDSFWLTTTTANGQTGALITGMGYGGWTATVSVGINYGSWQGSSSTITVEIRDATNQFSYGTRTTAWSGGSFTGGTMYTQPVYFRWVGIVSAQNPGGDATNTYPFFIRITNNAGGTVSFSYLDLQLIRDPDGGMIN